MAATHIALEFTEHAIRVAVASVAKATATITDLFSAELSAAPPGEETPAARAAAAAPLRQALRSRRVRPQRVVVVLPKAQVTTRRVYLPSNDVEEIARMAQFEAERHIPFHPERHIVSHHIVSNTGIEGAQVFLAAVDGPVVARALEIAAAADLITDVVTVSSVASLSALLLCEGAALREQVAALVDIGAESTDISIVSRGDLLFTRSVNVGALSLLAPVREGASPLDRALLAQMRVGSDLPDPGRAEILRQFVARVSGELRRTYEFSRREYECPPLEAVLVAGEGSLVERLAEGLGEGLDLPARRVELGRLAARSAPSAGGAEALAAHFACAGALIAPPPEGALSIDLTPLAHHAKRRAQRMRQLILVTGVLGLITVILTVAYLKLSLAAVQESADRYQRVVRAMEPNIREMEDKRTQIEIIQNFVDERNSALAILDFLSGLSYMPPRGNAENNPQVRMALNSFIYDRAAGRLEVGGLARELEDVVKLRADLEQTGFFSSVRIDNSTPRPLAERSGNFIDFTIKCDLLQTKTPQRGAPAATETASAPPANRRAWAGEPRREGAVQ